MNRIDFIRIGAVVFIVLMAVVAAFGAPHFVTPEMTLRNGLTDAQYEKLWAMGRSPRVDPQTARDWVFRASRYENTTNWFGLIGKTNDFARMAFTYASSNEVLVATNAALSAEVEKRGRHIGRLTNQVARLEVELERVSRDAFEMSQEMTNGLYAIEKTDRFYKEREESAPDEKLRTIYHEMRDYLGIIRREFETPPNGESK